MKKIEYLKNKKQQQQKTNKIKRNFKKDPLPERKKNNGSQLVKHPM